MSTYMVKAISGNDINQGSAIAGVGQYLSRGTDGALFNALNERITADPVNWKPLDVAMGKVLGAHAIHKFGENGDIDGAEEDVWDLGDTYTFSSAGVAMFVSSSDDGDEQVIEIQGLNAAYELTVAEVTLDGQTQTAAGTWTRIFRMKNQGVTNNAGIIYVYENDTVTAGVPQTATKIRGAIQIGNNQTLMAIYTVPAGHEACMTSWFAAISKKTAGYSNVRLFMRPFSGVFQLKESIVLATTGTSWQQFQYDVPLIIKPKSDIIIRADASAGDIGVSAGFDLILTNA